MKIICTMIVTIADLTQKLQDFQTTRNQFLRKRDNPILEFKIY